MHCKLHYISKAFGPKIWPDLETKWQNVISRWGLVRPHEPYHGLERGLLLFDLLIERFLVALSSVLLIELSHADKKFFIKPELNHWKINNHRKTYPWRSNFSESGWQYHRWFTAACELLYIFPRIIKHRIEISVSDQVQNRNGMLITDSACLCQKQRGQINISCVNKEKITYSRPFADNNHQDHSGSF